MFEPLSTTVVAGYSLALYFATRTGSAVSAEAEVLRDSASAMIATKERSLALFGAKSSVISQIHAVAAERASDEVDSDEFASVSDDVIERATHFVRAIPDALALPEVAADPDGSISFDWIAGRARVFSVSVGNTNRVSFAWIDGTDRGHGVARFDGDVIPTRVIEGICEIKNERIAVGFA